MEDNRMSFTEEIEEDLAYKQARERRRRERNERNRKRKLRRMRIRRMTYIGLGLVILLIAGVLIKGLFAKTKDVIIRKQPNKEVSEVSVEPSSAPEVSENEAHEEEPCGKQYSYEEAKDLLTMNEEVVSEQVIVVDPETNEIIAGRNMKTRMNPASMTKILTLLVAAEHVQNLDDTFTFSREITDYGFVNDCSSAGFLEDETVPIRDLFYGTILPSGADAAVGLAVYVAGSQEAFVDLMNEKLAELGLSETSHFTNCVGVYDENHYSTVYDMAVILNAAKDNEFCAQVLGSKVYTTAVTEQHPEGIVLSNWFMRRIEDKDTASEVMGAKTGYVVQSGSCAASYARREDGKELICVTGGSTSSWRCIYDHVAIYYDFMSK